MAQRKGVQVMHDDDWIDQHRFDTKDNIKDEIMDGQKEHIKLLVEQTKERGQEITRLSEENEKLKEINKHLIILAMSILKEKVINVWSKIVESLSEIDIEEIISEIVETGNE